MADDHAQVATPPARPTLGAEEGARLVEFARACKAAARAVTLYPDGHPAIVATLGRIAHLTSPASLSAPLDITVLPQTLTIENRALAKPEAAVAELAGLLHEHLIGQIVVNPGGDVDAWRSFLRLLGRSKESIRAEGGIARVWTTMAGRHVELREIDYSEVLRERAGGEGASWDRVIANCLQGSTSADIDESSLQELIAVVGDVEQLGDFLSAVERSTEKGAIGVRTAALLRLLQTIVERVGTKDSAQAESTMENIATAIGRLSPEMLMGLLSQGSAPDGSGQMVNAVVERMSDGTIAQFVARNVASESTATDRLAQVFQTLVPDTEQRPRLLALAREDVASSPLGSTEGFEEIWGHIAEKLLASYSDQPYVSEDYGRELSISKTQALQVEQTSDDPPERISGWLSTVATTALRGLDLALLLDLLRIEQDETRWGALMTPVAALLEDLLLVGDFESAQALLAVLVREAAPGDASPAKRQHAMIAIDMLVEGSMLRHVVGHLGSLDEAQFERVKTMCVSLGVVLVKPLAEMLAIEERSRTRDRLTAILVSFGPVARKTIERLKASNNAAVRRTAIYLMREFAGSEALPDLTELLGDNEPQVQREAVRAILNVGTDDAYQILQKALATGNEQSREAIMQAIGSVRDERATPLFTYILRNVDHRGPLSSVYLRAIESLGALKDTEGVVPLTEALYKGEWWAPGRTRALRTAAATALARIGSADALAALEQAASGGGRGVRAAVRPHLADVRRRQARRGETA